MKKLFRKIMLLWQEYWEWDERNESRLHLSQNDKRFLLLGAFFICLVSMTVTMLFLNYRLERISQRTDELTYAYLDHIAAYICALGEDEYQRLVQNAREDLMQYTVNPD